MYIFNSGNKSLRAFNLVIRPVQDIQNALIKEFWQFEFEKAIFFLKSKSVGLHLPQICVFRSLKRDC